MHCLLTSMRQIPQIFFTCQPLLGCHVDEVEGKSVTSVPPIQNLILVIRIGFIDVIIKRRGVALPKKVRAESCKKRQGQPPACREWDCHFKQSNSNTKVNARLYTTAICRGGGLSNFDL